MTPTAGTSPAWLGLFAVASFGGLVLASFASGYHLVVKAPLVGTAAPALESGYKPRPATVRQGLAPERAVVRSAPDGGELVARLPAEQDVSVRGREGSWLRIEYERDGKTISGWTPEGNLSFR